MKNIIWCFFLFFGYGIAAQEITPYFENFTKLEYNGENSNWDLAQHSNGTIYVANGRNLLAYNGDFWQKYQLPKPLIIRSVEVIDDTIYTGAYRQFGYWVENAKNKLTYHSLSDGLDEKVFKNDEIWNIISFGDKIYFQSFGRFFIYNRNSKEIEVVPFGNISAVYSFLIDGTIFITTKNHGIYKMAGNKLEFVPWSFPLKNFTIQSIAPFGEGILIATQLNGLFYYDGKTVNKWNSSLTSQFENLEINNLTVVEGNVYVGTINNGLLILDSDGNLKFEINKENGLVNNTVLRQMVDKNGNLWLGLDNGLSKIYLSEDFYWFNDNSGTLGTVYTMVEDSGELVLGSNHGVFYLGGKGLEFLETSNGQVWDFTKVGNEIIVGHNNGTFGIKNRNFYRINSINGGMGFKNIPGTEFYVQPNYSGVTHYKKMNGKWVYERYMAVNFPVRAAYFDANGNLWIEAIHRGIFQYRFRNNYQELELIKEYESSSAKNNLFGIGNGIFILDDNRVLKYDAVNDTLIRDKLLENKIEPIDGIYSLNNRFLIGNNAGALKLIDLKRDEQFILNEAVTTSRIVKDYPSGTVINEKIFVFMDDGFLKIQPSGIFGENDLITHVDIEQVRVRNKFVPVQEPIEIPFKKNSIHFFFSVGAPGILTAPKYSYKLEGYETDWSKPSFKSEKQYNNLPAGDYIFKVRSTNMEGRDNLAQFAFVVLPPWYLSNIALVIYLLLLLAGFYLIHLYNKRKYNRRQRVYKNKMEYEQKLAIQKHNFENNRKITQLEQEKLKNKLKGKSKELASYAALMAQKEDILREMEEEINKSTIKKDHKKLYNKLMDIRVRQTRSENEWKLFERNFNEVHDEFFKSLQSKYPNLTPKDLQLCAYLKLNLSSKEIAPLIGITFRSVELHRYRLRKKFHLAKNQNLVKFLIKMN
ncbi:MAG TPA: triple tyrosine motif-containing protein [Salinimicrobium sp.]|nr:triple tyrosine motif-containing protein [Salinimicrobium sp.]